ERRASSMGGGITTPAGLGCFRGLIAGSFSDSLGLSFHYTQQIFSQTRRHLSPGWPDDGRAATGIGRSVRSEVREVGMELERDPIAVVTLCYEFRPLAPRPLVVPGFAPEPSLERGWMTRPEDSRFAPEP